MKLKQLINPKITQSPQPKVRQPSQSKIGLGKREELKENLPYNWSEQNPFSIDLSKRNIIIFGGNTTNNSSSANGYAKGIESLLNPILRKKANIYSFSYENEPIPSDHGYITKDYEANIHQIFAHSFQPLLYNDSGEIKEKQGVEKVFNDLIFVAHCGGSEFVNIIVNDFYETLLTKYQPSEAKQLISKIKYFAYAPHEMPTHNIQSLLICPHNDINYSWAKAFSLATSEQVDNDYPKGVFKRFTKAHKNNNLENEFDSFFSESRSFLIKSGQILMLIPDRMNPNKSIGDHSIECITKPHILNSETSCEDTAKLANSSAKLIMNSFLSNSQLNQREIFTKISGFIEANPPTKQFGE